MAIPQLRRFVNRRSVVNLWSTLLTAAILMPLSSCDIVGFHRWDWSQRLTVTVRTPAGPKTASSVSAVHWEKTPSFLMGLGGGGYAGKITGEVVVLEIEPSRYLFSLFDRRYSPETAMHIFSRPNSKGVWDAEATENALNALEQGSLEQRISPSYYPRFVTFRDIADPSSVVPVAPEDFEKEFGIGISIAAVTLSITDEEPIDRDFGQILPWWRSYKNDKQLDGSPYADIRSSNRFANSLNSTNFKRD